MDVMGGSVIRSDIKHSDDTYCGTKISEVGEPIYVMQSGRKCVIVA